MIESADLKEQYTIKLNHSRIMRIILIVTGTILVGIGILGIFLPLLPTVIFFILAAWCYARSSEKFYIGLMNNKWFGRYLRNYHTHKGMTIKDKIFSLSILWITILSSIIFATDSFYIRLLLFIIAAGVTVHLLTIRTVK